MLNGKLKDTLSYIFYYLNISRDRRRNLERRNCSPYERLRDEILISTFKDVGKGKHETINNINEKYLFRSSAVKVIKKFHFRRNGSYIISKENLIENTFELAMENIYRKNVTKTVIPFSPTVSAVVDEMVRHIRTRCEIIPIDRRISDTSPNDKPPAALFTSDLTPARA